MGANMARRLKDRGYSVTAVHDSHAPLAAEPSANSRTALSVERFTLANGKGLECDVIPLGRTITDLRLPHPPGERAHHDGPHNARLRAGFQRNRPQRLADREVWKAL
jgi:hypothetical protein